MKAILTTILILTSYIGMAQTTSYRLAELEKFRTQTTTKLKADSIAISYLKKGKTTDSLRIKVLTDSLNKFKATWFNPADFIIKNSAKIDSISKRN